MRYIVYADFPADEIRRPEAEPLLYYGDENFSQRARYRTARQVLRLSNRLSRRSARCDLSRLRGYHFWAHDYSARIEGGVLLPARPDERDRGRAVSRGRGRVLRDS